MQDVSKNAPFPVPFLQACVRPSGGNRAPWKGKSDSGAACRVLPRRCIPWLLASTPSSCCSPLAWFIPVALASFWTLLECSALVWNCKIDIAEYFSQGEKIRADLGIEDSAFIISLLIIIWEMPGYKHPCDAGRSKEEKDIFVG